MNSSETDPRLFEMLASLNQIGATMNHIGSNGSSSVEETLSMIVESAIRVVPSSSAVIYTYSKLTNRFDPESRISAGKSDETPAADPPRPNGLGMRAITQRRRVISYEEVEIEMHPERAAAGVNAMCCFPLIVADEPVGALYVYLRDDRHFDQLELLMLDNFVNLAGMAIYHAHNLAAMQRDLTRKDDELIRLRRAGLLISSRLRLEDTLKAILQMALDITSAQYGNFRLLDRSGQLLVTRAIAGEQLGNPMVETLPINANSVMSWVARNRAPICIADLASEPWSQIYYPLDAELRMRSELAVPIIGANGRLEGVLNLESPAIGAFSEEDSHMLQSLATQAVIAIQEVRLLDALQEVARLLLTQPYQKVLIHLSELACDLLDASSGAIWTLKDNDLILEASSQGYEHAERIPLKDSLTGQSVTKRTPIMTNDVRSDDRFYRPDLAQTQNWSRALIVPLLAGDKEQPLGAFSVNSLAGAVGNFADSEWDKKVLICLADYAVLAYQNAARQEALLAAQEQRSVAETFAAVGDIASNLLHQLNNKVGTIPVRIQGIEDKCQDALTGSPYLAHNLDEIQRCATEAMESVRDSLSHLRPIRMEPVLIAPRVMDAISATQLPPSVYVRLEALDSLPVVLAGGGTLSLVFTNLLDNAADAMDGQGEIVISGSASDHWVNISVSDNGPGIPPHLHDHIFELNFSGRGASRPGKLGFGLWWVKTLMTRLGGSVGVESDGLHGTTFRLRLPRTQENEKRGEA